MIVAIYDTDEGTYRLSAEEDFLSCSRKVDVTQKFWDRYQAYEAEEEFIQSKLHRYYEDCRLKEKLDTKLGVPSRGF